MSKSDDRTEGCAYLVILGVIVIIALVKLFGGVPIEYSSGERVGVPVKVSYKGFFCKTYEGQMNVGVASNTGAGTVVPTTWNFSVADPNIVNQINEAADKGERVTLEYTQPLLSATCVSGSGYIVTKVRK